MARISVPKLFSETFGVGADWLAANDVFDPSLNVDTPLFIDPALLAGSQHSEMSVDAVETYRSYFGRIIELLTASKIRRDTYWRSALIKMRFPEIEGTCLGYGASSITGSGIGAKRRDQLLATAEDIVALGVRDPDLFVAMALFEAGVGADRIGDMTTNVILKDLVAFNERILSQLDVPRQRFDLPNGLAARLPRNPFALRKTPIILVPGDVLRHLPVASDWDSAMSAASENEDIRNAVNVRVGEIWKEAQSSASKERLREFALSDAENFDRVLTMMRSGTAEPYNRNIDPEGLLTWKSIGDRIVAEFPLTLGPKAPATLDEAKAVVEAIIDHFRFLVHERGLWSELYNDDTKKPRREESAQKLFYAVASSYCKANDIDVTPEAETGNGPVDFKFSKGFNVRIVVEIKLSTNGKVVHGYGTQTLIYRDAEETRSSYFILIDVGNMGGKLKRLFDYRTEQVLAGVTGLPQIELVDALPKLSASKRPSDGSGAPSKEVG